MQWFSKWGAGGYCYFNIYFSFVPQSGFSFILFDQRQKPFLQIQVTSFEERVVNVPLFIYIYLTWPQNVTNLPPQWAEQKFFCGSLLPTVQIKGGIWSFLATVSSKKIGGQIHNCVRLNITLDKLETSVWSWDHSVSEPEQKKEKKEIRISISASAASASGSS